MKLSRHMRRTRERMMSAAMEGHIRGRIYGQKDDPESPAEAYRSLQEWVDRQLGIASPEEART